MSEDSSLLKTVVPRPLQRRRQLERDLEHVTEEMYKRNRELAQTNQTLSLLRAIDSIVLESPESMKVVCDRIATAITTAADYPLIALLTRSPHHSESLELYGWSVKNQALPDDILGKKVPLIELADNRWLVSSERTKVVPLTELSAAEIATYLGCSEATARSLKRRLPVKSLYLVKLIARQRLVGVMVAGFFNDPTALSVHDIELMNRLSDPVGVAIDNRLLFEENRRVVLQLQHTNARLRELDETKDDFISMASHQLRTPLTSVKGYLSMVLEGDAGKLTPMERKMLTQAFISSQRMVYLIADLLNVSRLKTGKFIIESTPTDLSEMIDEEIKQLQETAASRSIKLTYKKPKSFPPLMLDETKTRQVIMNFIDNAIYYTPAGGRIDIQLIDRPTVVELKVVDNGIGVPKSEQPHLFTKFYRAGNARQARPDGTGLGLFMAKKVVTAQGGVVIFDSKEGKGSTFGFTFSKSKLAASSAVKA